MQAEPEQRRRQQIVAACDSCQVGRFRAPVESDLFRAGSPGHPAVVFPRTSVRIRRMSSERGREQDRFVTDTTMVVFHNGDDLYRREMVDPRGDDCVWLWANEPLLREIVGREYKRPARSSRLFSFSRGPCSRNLFLAERSFSTSISRAVAGRHEPDRLFLEESILELLAQAVQEAAVAVGSARADTQHASQSRFLTARATDFLAAHYAEAPTLERIAEAVGCSRFHLARVFRRDTGRTLHQARTELQLRAAYDRLCEGDGPISHIAHDLGFASHSHLTSAFRDRFGCTPSAISRG